MLKLISHARKKIRYGSHSNSSLTTFDSNRLRNDVLQSIPTHNRKLEAERRTTDLSWDTFTASKSNLSNTHREHAFRISNVHVYEHEEFDNVNCESPNKPMLSTLCVPYLLLILHHRNSKLKFQACVRHTDIVAYNFIQLKHSKCVPNVNQCTQ